MYQKFILLLLLGLVIGLPFTMKREGGGLSGGEEVLVIITPHNEALRYEFTRGFKEWYFKKRGKRIDVDWRVAVGTQDAVRLVDSLYENAFKRYWEDVIGKKWSFEVEEAYKKRIYVGSEKAIGPLTQEIYDVMERSEISCGMDLFFGGGKVDIEQQARKAQIVPLEIFETHADWFSDEHIPYEFGGNNFWDKGHRWVGTALSGFGIMYNRDSLKRLGFVGDGVKQWVDLGDPRLLGSVALTNPAGSAIFTVMFEIILQQQMAGTISRHHGVVNDKILEEGWEEGLRVIQKIAANGRYFTDAATQPVLDVSVGDCAVGMTIDFYGLFQEGSLKERSGSERFGYVMPKDGTVVSPDPIALFRGAPHKDAAEDFIEYVLSMEGQKLWDYKVGVAGGPKIYALSRAPIRREFYKNEYLKHRKNPDLDLYRDAAGFRYHPEWTGGLFREMRFAISVAFIDVHEELVRAWAAIIKATKEGRIEDAERARRCMENFSLISYKAMWGEIKNTLYSGDPLKEVQLRTKFSRHFREQYVEALAIAQAKGGGSCD